MPCYKGRVGNLWGLIAFALLWLVCTAGSCDRPSYSGNAPSLWINYSSSELDLVLVDHEPPPF